MNTLVGKMGLSQAEQHPQLNVQYIIIYFKQYIMAYYRFRYGVWIAPYIWEDQEKRGNREDKWPIVCSPIA